MFSFFFFVFGSRRATLTGGGKITFWFMFAGCLSGPTLLNIKTGPEIEPLSLTKSRRHSGAEAMLLDHKVQDKHENAQEKRRQNRKHKVASSAGGLFKCLCADWKKDWPLFGRQWIRSRGVVFCFWGLCRRSGASRGAGAAHFQPGRPARPILWDLSSFNSSTAESVIFHPCVCVCVCLLSLCYVQNDRCGGGAEEGPLSKKCVHWLKYVAYLKGGFLTLCRGPTLKSAVFHTVPCRCLSSLEILFQHYHYFSRQKFQLQHLWVTFFIAASIKLSSPHFDTPN